MAIEDIKKPLESIVYDSCYNHARRKLDKSDIINIIEALVAYDELLDDFIDNPDTIIEDIAKSAKEVIHNCTSDLEQLSFKPFDRIVFLGSGPLQGIAEESHLKVQELTDGSVVGKFDSFLGFRHGPKAVVNETTVIIFLFSSNEKVFRYEKDLVNEILQDGIAMHCIGVFCDEEQAKELELDQKIVFNIDAKSKISAYTSILYVLPSQILGLYKSIDLGLNPDTPSRKNVISRVVRGFTIYS